MDSMLQRVKLDLYDATLFVSTKATGSESISLLHASIEPSVL